MVSNLTKRDQFEQILPDYIPSTEVIKLLKHMKLVLLMGISASGRDSIIRELVKTDKYFDIVTDTTRKPRVNNGVQERSGVEYFFMSESEMLEGLERGEYIAPAIIHDQQVSAVSARELQRAQQQNKIAVVDVQIEGIDAILKYKPDTMCVFVMPPNFTEWMRRLQARSQLSQVELKRRLQSAQYELLHVDKEHYSVIINDNLADAVSQVRAITEQGAISRSGEAIRTATEQLKTQISQALIEI